MTLHSPLAPPYPPTICVLDGDLGGSSTMNGINNSILVGQEAAGHQQEAAVLLLQTPPQKSPAEAADPRCCPWNWRKR